MKILLLSSAYNGLTQRAHIELEAANHQVSIELALSDEGMCQAVELFQPDLILCPFLKQRVPESIWRHYTTIIIHPGIKGDRGPSSLDWAIMDGEREWGVTALQAVEEMDAGDIWATETFAMRNASKASIYRNEVTDAAIRCIFMTIERFRGKSFVPEPLDYNRLDVRGRLRPTMKQADRTIDWQLDATETIIRKINAADSSPGLRTDLCGQRVFVFGPHREGLLNSRGHCAPSEVIARRHGAICVATNDGALWISHLRKPKTDGQPQIKLPATAVLGNALPDVPELTRPVLDQGTDQTFREIWYEEKGRIGILHFDFYNGAMSSDQCERLRAAFEEATKQSTRVIVLMNGGDIWSNGIHLNMIEAADSPAAESWRNILAINDLIETIIKTRTHLTVAAVNGNAGAGGVISALAADRVVARDGAIFNPHYKLMGLFGSEYWTYLLPKRVGNEKALELMKSCLPVGMERAQKIGLVDQVLPRTDFTEQVMAFASMLADDDIYFTNWEMKIESRDRDETLKMLPLYRTFELHEMWRTFYTVSAPYHQARRNFVYKVPITETPHYLALHQQESGRSIASYIADNGVTVRLPDSELSTNRLTAENPVTNGITNSV